MGQKTAPQQTSGQTFEVFKNLKGLALPPIWNIPHARNPHFTGREKLLADLCAQLTSGQPAALTQAISGLGGVGKTQLAVEYAYRHAADYQAVWWLRAEEPITLASDYAALAVPLELPERDAADQGLIVEAVRQWLNHHEDWLLIFDNAADPAQVCPYFPHSAAGHVLITSRNPNWGRMAGKLPVREMAKGEAVEFLLNRTAGNGEELKGTEGLEAHPDIKTAEALAKELGYLPLALEQAVAYIEATGGTPAGYLALFRRYQAELLARGRPPADYPATVAATWELAFQQVQQASPAGAALLNLCAFLAPDDIPVEVITAGAKHLPEPLAAAVTNPLAFDEAVAALRCYSLIERRGSAEAGGGETLTVHRLVQAVARDRLAAEEKQAWAGAAVQLVNDAFPGTITTDPKVWPTCARLLPHALAAVEHAETLQVAGESASRLLNQAGLYLRGRAEFAGARAALERALAIGEAAFGPDHPNVAIRVNNLGGVLQDLGDLAGARAAYERALAIDEAAFGPDHPNVAIDVNNLGGVLQDLGDLAGARAAYGRALVIFEKFLGPEHPNVATLHNNLGSVLRDLGDLAGARAAYGRALAIDEAAFGPDHPNVAIRVNNLGSVLRALGDLAGARAAYERALVIFEKFLGPEHPNTQLVRQNLAVLGEGPPPHSTGSGQAAGG